MRFTPYYGVLAQLAGAKAKAALASGVANTVENVSTLKNTTGMRTMATGLNQVASMFGVSEAEMQYQNIKAKQQAKLNMKETPVVGIPFDPKELLKPKLG